MRLLKFGFVILVSIVVAVGCTKKVQAIKAANEISTNPVPGYPRPEDLNSVTLPPGLGGGASLSQADATPNGINQIAPPTISAQPSNSFLPKARPSHLAHSGKHHSKRHHHKRKH